MILKQYENMKDSGIERIGKISEYWKMSKLKQFCNVRGRVGWKGCTVDDLRSDGPLTLGPTYISKNNKNHFII